MAEADPRLGNARPPQKEILEGYTQHGLHAVPLAPASKKLLRPGKMADQQFTGNEPGGINYGVVLGDASSGLVDVDLDMAEARTLVDAVFGTGAVAFGRSGSITHLFVRHDGGAPKQAVFEFADKDTAHRLLGLEAGSDNKCRVIELRASAGQYTMAPPSIHPDGDFLAWWPGRSPDERDLDDRWEWDEIYTKGRLLAFLAVVLRCWPRADGSGRHALTMALTGALVRMGLDNETVDDLVWTLRQAAGDTDRKEGRHSADTRANLEAGNEVTGMPALFKGLGIAELLDDVQGWFGIGSSGGRKRNGRSDQPSPLDLARDLLAERPEPLLRFNGDWLTYANGAYRSREDEGMRAEVYRCYPTFSSKSVSYVLDALRSLVYADATRLTPPCWLDDREGPDPASLLVLRNGVLDLETGALTPHDPALFTRNALEFDYQPDAPKPERWLAFLRDIWPEEDEGDCHDALQQMFGYLLTPDTAQQKIFVLVGPPRSGKGTIGRVLLRLLGRHNVSSPTLSSLAEQFGLQSLIGKQLALVSDMRLGNRTDTAKVAETLLRVSGEDDFSVPRKHVADWAGRLAARFVIMSNEAPSLNDPSGALMSRYIVLQMRQSFLGREDRGLDGALAAELPGILNWAIEGWRRLRAEGRLAQPASSDALVRTMDRLSSPIKSFLDEECLLGAEHSVAKDALYRRFKNWADDADYNWKGSKELFGKNLQAAVGQHIRETRPNVGGKRPWAWAGIGLRPGPGYGDRSGFGAGPDEHGGGGLFARGDDDVPF
jgi:P4 family phage/plasmid primase-like protien